MSNHVRYFAYGLLTAVLGWFGGQYIYLAAIHPVPFTVNCWIPDADMRDDCHKQVAITRMRRMVDRLPMIDPWVLKRDRDDILADYREFLSQGIDPREMNNLEPNQLERLIDVLIESRIGRNT